MLDNKVSPEMERERCDWLEDLAFQGAALPERLTTPETLLFLKFRYLYAYAKAVHLSPEQGKKEKQEILSQYIQDKLNDDAVKEIGKLWIRLEAPATAVRKNQQLMEYQEVAQLLTALYGQ